jgi:DNA polymerase (family 10)
MSSKGAADAASLLDEIRRLLELRGENQFKVRAYERASERVAGLPDAELAERARAGTLTELEGIGKSIAETLTEYVLKGTSAMRDELQAALPRGLAEIARVPGVGPKKAAQLIEELDVHSIGELEYACREHRLVKLKGFGEKLQARILDGIRFLKATAGQQRLVDALEEAVPLLGALARAVNDGRHPAASGLRVSETGALRRRLETLSALEYLVELPPGGKAAADVRARAGRCVAEFLSQRNGGGAVALPVRLHFAPPPRYGYELARTTATEASWSALGAPAAFDAPGEAEFFARLGLPEIPAEARETGEEVLLARAGRLGPLLPWDGVRGVFHNHTTRSDGSNTLEEMVAAAAKLGYAYIGISDHSQSAFYAQGLKKEALDEQERELREVRERHPGIRVFWGIESDILADGSLDYEPELLDRFDFVIASIHSRFQMDRTTMTERILEAIRNPRTRFLGHATGRLLLGREGYAVDMERIIEEAARRDVAIEINANPARLDIDWRWGPQLRARGTLVSVNPDAHETAGLEDTRFGIAVARKALLPVGQVVNARDVKDVERWLRRA